MKPSRRLPRVGMAATVRYLAAEVPATITAVHDGGLRVTVLTAEEESIDFSLTRNTAHYRAGASGPRLILSP